MKQSILLTTMLIGFLVFSSAIAQPGHPKGREAKRQTKFAGLDLTEEQESKISTLRLEQQKTMMPQRDRVQALRTDYKLLVIDPTASDIQLRDKLNEISKIRVEMALNKAKHQRKVRSILTDDQKKKFDQHILMDSKEKEYRRQGARRPRGSGPAKM